MIFYFSGTGNTRWAAQQLAERTDEQLVFIPDVIDSDCRFALQADERLGFVFPVHGWRPPKLIRNFIKKLTISQAEETDSTHYTYMLCTAGDSIGRTKEIFEQDLAGRGLTLHAAFSILMPESYVGLPMMDVDTEPKEIAKLHQAWDDICLFATHIYNKVETEHLTRVLPAVVLQRTSRQLFRQSTGNGQKVSCEHRHMYQVWKMCRSLSRQGH